MRERERERRKQREGVGAISLSPGFFDGDETDTCRSQGAYSLRKLTFCFAANIFRGRGMQHLFQVIVFEDVILRFRDVTSGHDGIEWIFELRWGWKWSSLQVFASRKVSNKCFD